MQHDHDQVVAGGDLALMALKAWKLSSRAKSPVEREWML
jgi:hypothetical protein